MEPKGTVQICILEGKNLASKDVGGKSDPYCIISLDGQEARTEIIRKTLNPVWKSECFKLDVFDPEKSEIIIELYDWDKFSRDDFMGQKRVKLAKFSDEEPVDRWEKLEKSPQFPKESVKGDIHFTIQYKNSELAEGEAIDKYDFVVTTIFDKWTIDGLKNKLVELKPDNQVARALSRLLCGRKSFADLFYLLSAHEISKCQQETALFRTDVWPTKLFSAYVKLSSLPYLSKILKSAVESICKSTDSMELDPHRIEKGADSKLNLIRLTESCELFLSCVLNSLEYCPSELRAILCMLKTKVGTKFPDSMLTIVGGFFFLRYICPAIWQPEAFLLVRDPPSDVARRNLALIAKVLMSLSNGVEFGSKEEFMVPMNGFIKDHMNDVRQFLEHISEPSGVNVPAEHVDYRARDLIVLNNFFKM